MEARPRRAAGIAAGVSAMVCVGGSVAVSSVLAGGLAIIFLAVAVTAVAFVLWYSSVGLLGAGRAGLLTGVAPAAAAIFGVLLGGPAPRPLVWAGIAVVGSGLALGLRSGAGHAAPPEKGEG
jgi:drug/metabolite transporter (DMT)-like permease